MYWFTRIGYEALSAFAGYGPAHPGIEEAIRPFRFDFYDLSPRFNKFYSKNENFLLV